MKKILTLEFETLNISEVIAIATLRLGREVSRLEIANALETSAQWAIKNKDLPLSDEQIEKIEEALGTKLLVSSMYPGKIELKYWGEGLPCEDKLKNPVINSVLLDREIINTDWVTDENELNIIAMPGDKMDGGERPYRNGNILVIDKTQTDISLSGVYFFTTNNDEEVFVNNFRKTPFGQVVFKFNNPKYENYEVSFEEFENANIKVIGRVIHNLSDKS